jgi:hypothetical protein
MKNTLVAASSTPASSAGRALIAAASQRAAPDCPGVSTLPSGSTADIGGTREIETVRALAMPAVAVGAFHQRSIHWCPRIGLRIAQDRRVILPDVAAEHD